MKMGGFPQDGRIPHSTGARQDGRIPTGTGKVGGFPQHRRPVRWADSTRHRRPARWADFHSTGAR
ncbi:hypothetical protein EAO19_30965 [Klebsiella pneumoniae]|nr:hypothetical protein EAO19_30965 [Klebsiella pneumoniae]